MEGFKLGKGYSTIFIQGQRTWIRLTMLNSTDLEIVFGLLDEQIKKTIKMLYPFGQYVGHGEWLVSFIDDNTDIEMDELDSIIENLMGDI